MTGEALRCVRCGSPRDVTELLVVTEVRQPWRGFYVCRPSLPLLQGQCFRDAVGPASVHHITQARRAARAGGAS